MNNHAGVIPAINPGISVSRVGGAAQIPAMKKVAGRLKLIYSQYRELQAFAEFGSELDADTKERLELGRRIVEIMKQKKSAPVPVEYQIAIIHAALGGHLRRVAPKDISRCESELYEYMGAHHGELMERIRVTGELTDEDEALLDGAIRTFCEKFS